MTRNSILAALAAALVLASQQADARLKLPTPVGDSDFFDNGIPDAAKVELGRQLFFDKVLSGNLNISCATCHHPFAGTGDGLSLSVGEGARGTGVTRDTGMGRDAISERVPRNAPAIFNLGAREFATLFHDGRIEPNPNYPGGLATPAGHALPTGLENALAAQAMFPVASGTEMAGQAGENSVADAAHAGDLAGRDGVWAQLAERLRNIDAYARQFVAVFDDVSSPDDIQFVHAANAIAAFEAAAWRSDDSPFDRFLRGERGSLSFRQLRGMGIFYSRHKGNCAGCHSGPFQTDHSFRAIAVPQIGPGKGDGAYGYEDFGRERVTEIPADRYRFRVPSLRNIELTAPYGHSGAFDTLEAMVRHHLDSTTSLYEYDPSQAVLPSRANLDALDFQAAYDETVKASLAAASELRVTRLNESEIDALLDFLRALTDPAMIDLRRDVPASLPSGLPLAD